jgi:hypothetical protein
MTNVVTAPYRRGAETLNLTLGSAVGGWVSIESYDFMEYQSRYHAAPPEPRYILRALRGTGADASSIEVEYSFASATGIAVIGIPSHTAAGTGFVIPTPAGANSTLRLLRLRRAHDAGQTSLADEWEVTALLGNLAKLAWVLGSEKDQIGAQLQFVSRQRNLSEAHGYSLDKIGESLRVPRFPARPYSFDADTVALYHFDSPHVDARKAADTMADFRREGHHGRIQGTVQNATGKFGNGLRLSGHGAVIIPAHTDFDIAANESFTVEAFVKPDAKTAATTPRAILSKTAQDVAQPLTEAGWALSVGNFRGIAHNVRWSIADADQRLVELYADMNISDGRIHHIACVIDRAGARARLFVDGEERASAALGEFGAVINDAEIQIGGIASAGFYGVMDEVRFSKVARTLFHPALGEGDEEYRRRLGVFTRWFVPSPKALADTINELVKIGDVSPSFVLSEEDNEMALTHRKIRILPRELQRGATISAEGYPRVTEAQAAGTLADDAAFDAAWLVVHDSTRVDYGDAPHAHMMQLGAARALDRLLERLRQHLPTASGRLLIKRAYDPAATDLHRVGRSLLISHPDPALRPGKLAVHAHAVGFDYVSYERSGLLKVSVRKSEPLEIVNTSAGSPLVEGGECGLRLYPVPPGQAKVRWTVVRSGIGDGVIEGAGSIVTFRALTAGTVLLRVEVTQNHQTVTGSLYLRIGVSTLAPNATLGGDGRRGVTEEEASGALSPHFHEQYLVTHADERIDYGTDPQNRRMQASIVRVLERLLSLLPTEGRLKIERAFTPQATDLFSQGRALRLTHTKLTPAQLAPLAFTAGFDFIRHESTPPALHVSVAQADLITIAGADELEVDESIELRLEPASLPLGGATGESVAWSAIPLPRGRVELSSDEEADDSQGTRRVVEVTGREPGVVAVRAMYLHAGKTDPYQFELRLVPELDHEETFISKDQYDVIMNLLNNFHPVGVKVLTDRIRRRVVEVREGQLEAFPGYTYPKF